MSQTHGIVWHGIQELFEIFVQLEVSQNEAIQFLLREFCETALEHCSVLPEWITLTFLSPRS